MRSPESAAITVFGATGVVGRRVCAALATSGVPFEIAGRDRTELDTIAAIHPVAHVHLAEAGDPASLASAFAGARVVINAAGPARETSPQVLEAALTAGAHCVDLGGEQAALHELYERHESTARRAGLVALPGAGLDALVGDLAVAWAAAHVCGVVDEGPTVRTAPADRIAEDRPLDETCVSYVFDDLVLSAGSQRAVFGGVGQRPLVWRRDRWEPGRAGERRHVNAGPSFGGERNALGYAGGDVITIPRHVATQLSTSYLSTTRDARVSRALGWVARALPLVPRAATELLAPYAPADVDYARTRFAIVGQVRRGFSAAQIVVRGVDIYQTTATIAAWAARMLATRMHGPIGMRAPGELFRAEPALRELASIASLVVEPSFG